MTQKIREDRIGLKPLAQRVDALLDEVGGTQCVQSFKQSRQWRKVLKGAF